jgi:hypothetical protein
MDPAELPDGKIRHRNVLDRVASGTSDDCRSRFVGNRTSIIPEGYSVTRYGYRLLRPQLSIFLNATESLVGDGPHWDCMDPADLPKRENTTSQRVRTPRTWTLNFTDGRRRHRNMLHDIAWTQQAL